MQLKKLPSLHGLRGVSILFVIIGHSQYQFGILNSLTGWGWMLPVVHFISNSQVGVNLFFIISGFLITYLLIEEESAYGKISIKYFYFRRVLRIFPAYYFLLMVYGVLQLLNIVHISNASWLTAITFTKYFNFKLDWLTAHAWTLSVEEQFYLVWPLLFILGKRWRKGLSWSLFFAVPILRVITWYYPVSWRSELHLAFRIDAIALGCLCAFYKDQVVGFVRSKYAPIVFFAAVLLLISLPHLFRIADSIHLSAIWWSLSLNLRHTSLGNICMAFIMMFSIYSARGLWFNFLNSRILIFIGYISYSLYLWQQFFINGSGPFAKFFPLNLVMLFLVATISYYFIEKPFLLLKKRFR